ncbi:MAG: dynamin family protein [Gammaproteobacteria bacterium]
MITTKTQMVEAHAYSTDKTRSHNEGYKMTHNDLLPKIASLYSEIEAVSVKFPEMQKECRKNSDDFGKQYENTINENRRLRIAIIGQVKAGKSSFLNTFLFDGEEVLPKAATPKTANLTIIRHDDDCRVEIEFYNQSDWDRLISSADNYRSIKEKYDIWMADSNKQGKSIPTNPNSSVVASYKAAFEMVETAKKNGLDIASLIASKRKCISFEDLTLMRKQLNEYVGENGRLTPVTKAVYLYVNEPRLKDLEIVDTPGLNDPVPARTEKTREILKTTDVAFFLSQTGGSFFDANDVNLLVSQLPSEGINYFVLIGSRYDSALQGCLEAKSLLEAVTEVQKLSSHADRTLKRFLDGNEYINAEVKAKLLGCLPPIFISSIMQNFAIKNRSKWDDNETWTYGRLQLLSNKWQDFSLDNDTLLRLANFSSIVGKYEIVKKDKHKILEQKVSALAPAAAQKLQELIRKIRDKSQTAIDILQQKGVADLEWQERQLRKQVEAVKAGIAEVIGDMITACSQKAIEMRAKIREETSGLSRIDERTGTRREWVTKTVAVSGGGACSKTRYEDASYERNVTYSYLTVNDALDNLRSGAIFAEKGIEKMFSDIIEPKKMRIALLKVIRDSLDAEDDSYNPDLFKRIIQDTITQIEFPRVALDTSSMIEELANMFSQPELIGADLEKLRYELIKAMSHLSSQGIAALESEVTNFKAKLQIIRDTLGNTLIEQSISEIQKLKKEMQNKEQEIEEYTACVKSCEQISQKVTREIT